LFPWGAAPYSKWRGVGKEEVSGGGRGGGGDGTGNPLPPPPFCLPEGGGRLPRAPTYGYASTGKGRPPPGEPPGEREASPREAPS